ncbi:MAG TPA: hypothetical protein VM779_00690 [Thermoanaerobaculia bacterium]|nr:hypothetical protein [Thermoanaerobaculia bacterium]
MRSVLVALLLLPTSTTAQEVTDVITVERILIDARVTDYDGDPILGLTVADFDVRVGGKRAVIESVEWIPETEAARAIAAFDEEPRGAGEDTRARKGRLFLYFVQTDFARNSVRVRGHMKFMHYAEQMIEALEEHDRVAVFSFDSHLKFRLDFTADKSDIIHALRQAVLTDNPSWPPLVPNPSLARRLDRDEMKRFTSSDEAFIHIANAVRHIPGPKSMILFGWGLGQLSGNQVVMHRKYPIARRALEQARVTVFSLDTTDADYHDLEFGLGTAAKDTGGFYAKTHIFPQIAVARLQKTLAGHYELEVRRPAGLRPGTHEIDVRVKRRGTYVMARSTFMDEPR